jgi:hypothetical protein
MLDTFRKFGRYAALAFWTLVALEMPVYFLVKLIPMPPINFYIILAITCGIGMLLGKRNGKDVGRTIFQLYMIDGVVQLLGLAVAVHLAGEQLSPGSLFAWKTLNIGLSFCKILALTSMLAFPDQPGWPSLIPFVKLKRDIVGDPQYDRIIYIGVAAAMLLGAWVTWNKTPYEMAVFATPMFILMLIIRSQTHVMHTRAGNLSEGALAVGMALDDIADPVVRAKCSKSTVENFQRIAVALRPHAPTPTQDSGHGTPPNAEPPPGRN